MSDAAIVSTKEGSQSGFVPDFVHSSLATIPGKAQGLLFRMFADPRVLTKEESGELLTALRGAVTQNPRVSELRVLYGMALCVNLDPQTAMDELAEAVSLAPDSYIAHLKMGELWMRLRVMDKAEDHTRQASVLAENMAQSELARRQAAMIREIRRKGVARDGYRMPWFSVARVKRLWTKVRNNNKGLESGQNEELDTVGAQ